MDPPPPAPPSTAPVQAAPITTNATSAQLNCPESVESSPRSRIVENWVDEPLPAVPGAKLRLMCSYGGHIMPRPHDKTLCYIGGDTRIVVVDRHSSLKELCGRLSRTLLNGRPFTLKYQLPHEDLDNLISVSTDEDLENMIEEHERLTAASPPRPTRLRLFLFFSKPESTVSMGSLLDDAKSETWFVDALNNSGILTRGVSDSAAVEGVVNLDKVPASNSSSNLEAQATELQTDSNRQVKNLPEVHSLPDSPLVDNSSSYGSSSSSPSMANLPPIRVRIDEIGNSRLQQEQRPGIEEQLAQMTFVASGIKQDEGYAMTMLSAPMPTIPAPMTMSSPALVTSDNMNRVISDDERSDQGAPAALRKPPLPLQLAQPRTSGGLNLPSPDSVASDSSIASAASFSRSVYYQDQVQAAYADQKAPALSHSKNDMSDPNAGYQRERVQDSNYTVPPPLDQSQQIQQQQHQQQQQQQFVHASTHYIPHTAATGQVPMSSYYPVYATPSQQQIPHPINQQYPVYVMPVGHAQPYNMTMQADPNVMASSRPLISQSVAGTPPVYPTKPATPSMPEVAAQTVYKAPVPPTPAFVQMPSGQYQQQQYVGVPQIHHQPQSITVASSAASAPVPATTSNYGYDYGGPAQEQAYYIQQQQTAPLPSQYQSMTPAAAAAFSDASKQFPGESIQQPNRATQPL
ncbi:flocculation protein FLO11-like [Neltuma alba]|uniref:flocculation protein FLO11-like n=1 Tax=Neltuma alba TaxID=207710 RepID=UPI0010A3BD7D|nr:flocculation protein FLO11-like [Prosopis alba]